ncbi:MAG: hypothetical protein M3N82_00520, partial [Pseudomonadota bacterium]|nr:hypothetical protein [Pseudomonadota bacterium]
SLPLLPDALAWAVAREGLERLYRVERWLPRFDGAVLAGHVRSLAAAEKKLLALNARVVRAGVHHRFLRNVQRSTLAASQLDSDGKAFKKAYSAGRRELEHEFGKTMRYKAIRELASGDPGRVVRDMKPVWLMSPLSVSDTLPLATDCSTWSSSTRRARSRSRKRCRPCTARRRPSSWATRCSCRRPASSRRRATPRTTRWPSTRTASASP